MKSSINNAHDGIAIKLGDTTAFLTWEEWDALVSESLKMRNDGIVRLHVGSKVKWSSGGSGISITKRGVVVAVVPKGKSPFENPPHYFAIPDGYDESALGGGLGRSEESYLVAVGRKLYWPRTSHLVIDDGGE